MQTTVIELLKAAREKGHSLSTLIACCKKFAEYNSSMIIADNRQIINEFAGDNGNMLTALPEIQYCDVLDTDTIKAIAESKNYEAGVAGFKEPHGIPGKL
jgi:hypothetical protein